MLTLNLSLVFVLFSRKTVSPPKTPVSQTQALLLSPNATAHDMGGGASPKPAHFLLRGHPELYYQDQRSPTCDVPPYQTASESSSSPPHCTALYSTVQYNKSLL